MKNKSVLVLIFVFLFVSCNRKEKVYMPVSIPEDNILCEIDFEKLKDLPHDDTLTSLDFTCNINSACIKTG
ncbi:MAG: hypothetical protein II516_08045, partial [Treponema sp.]|nr:hypothetical protein [Treponema sp.]